MPIQRRPASGEILNTLALKTPFQVLDTSALQQLCARARLQDFATGEQLYSEGQTDVLPAFLLSGMVKLTQNAVSGKECLAHMVRAGHFLDVGVMFYTSGLPFSACGVKAGQLVWFDRRDLAAIVQRDGKFAYQLLSALALRQKSMAHKMASTQGRISAQKRVVSWLLHRAKLEKTHRLDLMFTREVMAGIIGIRRESLSRVLSSLATAGLIENGRKHIALRDVDALQQLVMA